MVFVSVLQPHYDISTKDVYVDMLKIHQYFDLNDNPNTHFHKNKKMLGENERQMSRSCNDGICWSET